MVYFISRVTFVPHFGHPKVYVTFVWTPCFQIMAKPMGGGGGGGKGVVTSTQHVLTATIPNWLVWSCCKMMISELSMEVRAWHWCLPHCPGQVKFVNYSCENLSCLPHWASTLFIFQVCFLERVPVLWSGIQACPRKHAFTYTRHVLLLPQNSISRFGSRFCFYGSVLSRFPKRFINDISWIRNYAMECVAELAWTRKFWKVPIY